MLSCGAGYSDDGQGVSGGEDTRQHDQSDLPQCSSNEGALMDIAELGVLTGWFKSKSAVRREITNGGFRINDYRLTDPFCEVFYSKRINHIMLLEIDNRRQDLNVISPPSKDF